MIKVSAFYPTTEGATVDMDYYVNKHIPMVISKLGSACKGAFVEEGLGAPEGVSRLRSPPWATAREEHRNEKSR